MSALEPRAGCVYPAVRIVRHAARDMADLAARGYDSVLHPLSPADLERHRAAVAAVVSASAGAGLEVQLSPWPAGLPLSPDEPVAVDLQQWLSAAAQTGAARVLLPASAASLVTRATSLGLRATLLRPPDARGPAPAGRDLAAVAAPATVAGGLARASDARTQLFLPIVGLRLGDLAELERAVAEARAAGVDELWTFSYEAGADLSERASPDAAAVWEAATALITSRQGLDALATEGHRADLADLDLRPTRELVRLMAGEDRAAADAVAGAGDAIADAVEAAAERLRRGGRLIYAGAGSSGRLAAVDASEAGPTFNAGDRVLAVVAGGANATPAAQEAAEDDAEAGRRDVAGVAVGPDDVVVALSASGRTPYALGAAHEALAAGALLVGVVCSPESELAALAAIEIRAVVGPEVVTGSTRLKAGTAQKLILNALSTLTMVRLGRTYGNLMVDVRQANGKLRVRARRTVALATGAPPDDVDAAFAAAGGDPKVAIVALLGGLDPAGARERLAAADGSVRAALNPPTRTAPDPIVV